MGCGASTGEDTRHRKDAKGKRKGAHPGGMEDDSPSKSPRREGNPVCMYQPHEGYPVHEPRNPPAWARQIVHGILPDRDGDASSSGSSDKNANVKNPLRAHDHHFEAEDEDVLVCDDESCGHETGEPGGLISALRLKAKVASASWSHGVNSDVDQFKEEIERQWYKHKMKKKSVKRISAWADAVIAGMIVLDGTADREADNSDYGSTETPRSYTVTPTTPQRNAMMSPGVRGRPTESPGAGNLEVWKDPPQMPVERGPSEVYCCSTYIIAGLLIRLSTGNLLAVRQRYPSSKEDKKKDGSH